MDGALATDSNSNLGGTVSLVYKCVISIWITPIYSIFHCRRDALSPEFLEYIKQQLPSTPVDEALTNFFQLVKQFGGPKPLVFFPRLFKHLTVKSSLSSVCEC